MTHVSPRRNIKNELSIRASPSFQVHFYVRPDNYNFGYDIIDKFGEIDPDRRALIHIDLQGIAASSGSACTSGSFDPSHVLLSIGLPHEVAHGSLRISMSEYTTEVKTKFGEYGEMQKGWTAEDAKGFIKVTSTPLRVYYNNHKDEEI